MAVRLKDTDPDFASRFAALLTAKREVSADVDAAVKAILADVRASGDAAVAEYTAKFDRVRLAPAALRVASAEIDAADKIVTAEQRAALRLAHDRIAAADHRRALPSDDRYRDEIGVELGTRWTAISAVGLYVPGGTAAYPSSVLMNAVPARVAGVERIVMVTPAPDGKLNPLVLAAARLAGVDEIYKVGGAQAVAALAYGTATIAPVDKIGPGNAYVAAAKRQVFGTVGIDMIAGPSEVLVIADADNDPDWIAADLVAQAEHDAAAQSILITDSPRLANDVAVAVERQLKTLPRAAVAGASWRDHGAIIVVKSLAGAMDLANRIAAEHVELAVAAPDALLMRLRNAGAAFLGRHTPEVIGDYVAGSNHVLPTARSARFSSGLSVFDFLKRTSILRLGAAELRALADSAITLAESEGLAGHARSVAIRLNRGDG